MTCSYCGRLAHEDEPVVQSRVADIWMHVDCYFKRQMTRRPAAVRARLTEILGARVMLN